MPERSSESQLLRILIVDDDQIDRERIRRVLGKGSVKSSVQEANSLGEARSYLKSDKFDCVFLDYKLGDASGTELLHDIQSGSIPYVPVIMVTGEGNERLVVQTMRDGAHDFISKMHLQVGLVETILINSQIRANLERELKIKRERLEYLSFHDTLTGLPNRTLFFDRAEQTLQFSMRKQQIFAILQIDLDLFKNVNDTFGHAAGDVVLTAVAQRIQSILRGSDTVARLGGDEFAVVLADIKTTEDALHITEKITQEVRKPIQIFGDQMVAVEASVGIALFPDHGEDVQTLLLKADWAMYAAKHGAGLYLIYAAGMESMRQRPAPESERLRQALICNELFLEYQPFLDLASGEVIGFEALVRWRTPEGEVVPPSLFIPLAERSPVIAQLTYWILCVALDQMQRWHMDGLMLSVSVNISARMLDGSDLAERVLHELRIRKLPASFLTLELTETALMSNVHRAYRILEEIKNAGVRISIDDFGAGFTSFKYLRQLDVSEIKIDMAFTADLKAGSRDSVIVRSIAQLARGFGITSVAEGIEDLGNKATLLELGCQVGQGYGIARPMAGGAVAEWVKQWNERYTSG
ncbi:EAL domain-containing protein [Rhodoferax sp. GW822-FHT02A01]|uniref:two-component system response regulator n=1 Tax=Rhodoferax sp. GW822-FHT02A01 TaxID=3141537 RepID=UPI00315CAED7